MLYLGFGYIGVGLGAGLCLIGGGIGISRCASAALEGLARQPEAVGPLQTMMIIPAAMIEGLGLLALVAVFLSVLALNKGVPAAPSSSGAAPAAAEAHAR
ncbi:MAG: ATP synthase F0 subunit C [Elusimicrobia bacterium]|nr:ATP synthase F0 subunit C [Elusimicrobiota bacterium]MDE2426727.1 ATP synthase F0 subunit C [Elusimicrobiota bacterium]